MAGATTREIMEAAGHKTLSQAARITPTSRPNTPSPWWTGSREQALGNPTCTKNMHRDHIGPAKGEQLSAELNNINTLCLIACMVPGGGLEPPQPFRARGF